MRVTYFTIVPLAGVMNGGLICCRNNLERLNSDPGIECSALVASHPAIAAETLDYFHSKNIRGEFIPFQEPQRGPDGLPSSGNLPWSKRRWPFPHEIEGWEQSHIGAALEAHISANSPDIVVVDYLPSALYVPKLYKSGIPIVTITLNREADYYDELARLGQTFYGKPANRVAAFRLRMFEKLTHWRSKAIVAIGRYDVPQRYMGRPRAFWIPPYLDPVLEPWSYSATNSLYFVGNRGHYPNGLAIEWIATEFAPELQRLNPTIKVRIVGASVHDVPEHWLVPNIEYLGFADEETVRTLFTTEDVLLVPIDNNFGAKFKVAEAIAFGTPLLATKAAMSGVSFLPWLPNIQLEKPAEAARLARDLVADAAALRGMSKRIRSEAQSYIQMHEGEWTTVLRAVLGRLSGNGR